MSIHTLVRSLIESVVPTAAAHCDTADGPAVTDGRRAELHRRFETALGKKKFDANDVPAARDYVAAYVSFFKYAEGEDHEHQHVHGQDAHAHHGAAHRH